MRWNAVDDRRFDENGGGGAELLTSGRGQLIVYCEIVFASFYFSVLIIIGSPIPMQITENDYDM